jgi:tetratricopeptide (TPR) repeat protein
MVPEIVGRYELLRPLGAGGMGEVFLARDETLDRLVAIKRLNADNSTSAKSILHEARIVASLDHPNIASVFDVVEHAGQPHVVMEYVEGPTLATRIASGPLTESEVIAYGRQIADALAYAHARNVVHCDIKPSNVMLTPADVPKVLDFGIARREIPAQGGATTTIHIRGTPAYMAPEAMLGAAPTPQSDVFSLGVVLYELAVGRRPFSAPNHSREGSASLDHLARRVSPGLAGVIERAIEIDPRRRIQSAEDIRIALVKLSSDETRTSKVLRRPSAAGKTAALLGGLALACTLLVMGIPPLATSLATKQPSVLGVMMFNNTGDAENDYIAAGMADVLVSHLADAPGVTVVPRTAMATLTKESQVQEAVKALGLTHVLTGSVQRSGESLRLAISLLGDKGAKVEWSRSFDGKVSDVLHVEQRIGEAALQAMRSRGLVTQATVAQARENPPTSNPDAFDDYAHGRALIERADVPGNVGLALSFFERAVERDPAFARAHAAIGDASWRRYTVSRDTSWIDRARSAMLSAIRLAPDDPTVNYTMAEIDRGTGRADDAINTLEAILDKQPAFDSAHRLLGRIYSERNDFDRAITEFREAESIRPDYPATVRELGLAYYDKGRFEEAIASFTKLTTLQPDNAPSHSLLGTAYHAAGELDRALAAYRQANSIAPRATTYSNIGSIHYARGEYPAAIDAYRQAIAIQSKEATTHRNLADALWLNGDKLAARAEYQAAMTLANETLKVNPSATRSRSLIAYCQAKLGNIDQARALIASVVKNVPNDSDAAYKQAVIEALGGRSKEALRYLERALALGYSRAVAESDRDLDSIRSLPAFSTLMER